MLRDLDRLKDNLRSYKDEYSLWKIHKDIKNSGGNLCLHICGNLQHFLGHIILENDYLRDRKYEFEGGPESRDQLYVKIDNTKKVIEELAEKWTEESCAADYPIDVLGYKMSTAYFLVHLYGHLNYHMGQINYHRRLMIGSNLEAL
jgi:uncharacterized damage-inducible protein DinB